MTKKSRQKQKKVRNHDQQSPAPPPQLVTETQTDRTLPKAGSAKKARRHKHSPRDHPEDLSKASLPPSVDRETLQDGKGGKLKKARRKRDAGDYHVSVSDGGDSRDQNRQKEDLGTGEPQGRNRKKEEEGEKGGQKEHQKGVTRKGQKRKTTADDRNEEPEKKQLKRSSMNTVDPCISGP